MKAVLALALVVHSLAAVPPLFNEIYYKLNTNTFACDLQPGYVFKFATDAAMDLDALPLIQANLGVTPDNTDPTMATACAGVNTAIAIATCSDGWRPTGLAAATQTGAFAEAVTAGPPGEWQDGQVTNVDATVWQQGYDFSTATFVCVKETATPENQCAYTCTGNCLNGVTSGIITNGTSFTTVCTSGNAGVATPTTCPTGGLYVTTAVVCTDDPADIPADQWYSVASLYPHTLADSTKCSCDSATYATTVVCPEGAICSQCYLPCNTRRSSRANNFDAAGFCPGLTAIADQRACFERLVCAGVATSDDTCFYGGLFNDVGRQNCPVCPDGSKKGLLGLLGLLGLIPLLLLLLCSSLLLCLIRRKKKERDVHFATFDAGAPAVLAPCAEVAPVALTHSHVHHATYVGAPHVDAPGCIAY